MLFAFSPHSYRNCTRLHPLVNSETESVSAMLEEVRVIMAVEEEGTYARQFSERARKNLAMVRDMAAFAQFIF